MWLCILVYISQIDSSFQGIQLDSELMQLIIQQDTRQQLRQLLIDMI